jgi:hypothetical protein
VNLPSAKQIASMNIGYNRFLSIFAKAIAVDDEKLKEVGTTLLSKLEGKTPAEACGITVQGKNKWKTLIQNASLSRS